jgi:hypothetical protein
MSEFWDEVDNYLGEAKKEMQEKQKREESTRKYYKENLLYMNNQIRELVDEIGQRLDVRYQDGYYEVIGVLKIYVGLYDDQYVNPRLNSSDLQPATKIVPWDGGYEPIYNMPEFNKAKEYIKNTVKLYYKQKVLRNV